MKRVSGTGNWDQPNHTTCSGRPLSTNATYSAFWSVFGVRCPKLQRLASSVGFGTTARLGPRKNPSVARRGCARRWRLPELQAQHGDGVGGEGVPECSAGIVQFAGHGLD